MHLFICVLAEFILSAYIIHHHIIAASYNTQAIAVIFVTIQSYSVNSALN